MAKTIHTEIRTATPPVIIPQPDSVRPVNAIVLDDEEAWLLRIAIIAVTKNFYRKESRVTSKLRGVRDILKETHPEVNDYGYISLNNKAFDLEDELRLYDCGLAYARKLAAAGVRNHDPL